MSTTTLPDADRRLTALRAAHADRIAHIERLPSRAGSHSAWPGFVPDVLRDRFAAVGVPRPWRHQAAMAELAWAGTSTVVATGTASGKSLGYLVPVLAAALVEDATTLYLSPTKALAADQLRRLDELAPVGVRAATCDGDTPREERDWVRAHAQLVLTNPDMLHRSLLPAHARWARLFSRLRFVVVDECHEYRGVFGSHVAAVLRRLRRVAAHYGAQPTFLLASATVAEPEQMAGRLIGVPVTAVVDDTAPRGETTFVLWEPPLTDTAVPTRRTATAEAADLLADLVVESVPTLAFVRSRRGAEAVALSARRLLDEAVPGLGDRVAAYRAGYLPEERRALERAIRDRRLLGLAATRALELGVDISGLDAVVIAGYPGTRAAVWQQAGRAGRQGRPALAVLVARDDPLDTYLVHHPDALFGQPVETTVLDPTNPYVLTPHLAAAAAELPLTDADLDVFGAGAAELIMELCGEGLLRRRPTGWYWTRPGRAADLTDLRGDGGALVRIVEADTGRVLGTVAETTSHAFVHDGAVYLHQGESYLVRRLDLADSVALVTPARVDYTTIARDTTDLRVVALSRQQTAGGSSLCLGSVDVTHRVVSYVRRRLVTGEVLGEVPLDLPERRLRTTAVWWTVDDTLLRRAEIGTAAAAGAAHAAEHASIGLLPLFATCDRWDIGGVSTARHPDTERLSVFVYDGHPGGAGFAERGYGAGMEWLRATAAAVRACNCSIGCPACVQSPKCGNGNEPLDKAGAVRLLDVVISELERVCD